MSDNGLRKRCLYPEKQGLQGVILLIKAIKKHEIYYLIHHHTPIYGSF
jgi:hypothetical protein